MKFAEWLLKPIPTNDMMMEIKKRVERGFYKRSEILFDTRDEMEILDRYNLPPHNSRQC